MILDYYNITVHSLVCNKFISYGLVGIVCFKFYCSQFFMHVYVSLL